MSDAELSLPQVQGPRPLPLRVSNAYIDRAQTAAEHDTVLARRLLRVVSLQDRPTRMFRPSTAGRVLLGNLRRHRRDWDHAAVVVRLRPGRR